MANIALYDKNSTMYVLGAVMKRPDLIHDPRYSLTTNDFSEIQEIIFKNIYNLSIDGINNMTPQEIDLYLKQNKSDYQKYSDENGFEYLSNIYNLSPDSHNEGQFNLHYTRIKKFTVLRDLYKNGIDIKDFYNPDVNFLDIDKENEKLNSIPIEEIFNKIREKLSLVEEKNIGKPSNNKVAKASEGLRELVEGLKLEPDVGYPLDGKYLNYAAKGARLGKFYLYSAPSGHGKTRFFVGNACSLSLPYIEKGSIITKEDLAPVLFIVTEMDIEEIQTLILAYVSGVDEEKIKTGKYSPEEEKLIEIAIGIIERYENNFIIEKMSDPSIEAVRAKITKYIITDKITHVFYDYIFTSPALNREFRPNGLREDVVLMMLSNTLKELASDYNAFIYSGTQVNREWEKKHFRNENNIAGSKAVADKADFGVVAVRISEEEKEKITTLLRADGILEDANVVLDVYKNRGGRITNAKIFRAFDYGTCRAKDLIMTDTNYQKWFMSGEIVYNSTKKDLLELVVDKSVKSN